MLKFCSVYLKKVVACQQKNLYPINRGAWIAMRKIGSIGIAVRRATARHIQEIFGVQLNPKTLDDILLLFGSEISALDSEAEVASGPFVRSSYHAKELFQTFSGHCTTASSL